MKLLRILLLSLCTLATVSRAEIFTVTLVSTTQAKVTEDDAPPSIEVAYGQNGGNGKGWYTQGAEAELLITGIPTGLLNEVQVYMRSNAKGGSGSMTLQLDEQDFLSFSGPFADWQQTGYSTTFLPFAKKGAWRVTEDNVLRVYIKATANSLYLQQVVVDYTPDPPVPQCLDLYWTDGVNAYHEQLCEQEAATGILLPEPSADCLTIIRDEGTYRFIGWTPKPIETATTRPYVATAGKRYYIPSSNHALYALYRMQNDHELVTTNDLQSGEYALAVKASTEMLAMAAGRVSSKLVPASYIPIQRNDTGYVVWRTAAVPDEVRYRLQVNGDSVTIYHPATNSYLAYNNSGSLSPSKRPWAWHKTGGGTICIFHDSRSETEARSIVTKEGDNNTLYWGEGVRKWTRETECMFLFDVSQVPATAASDDYTTFPSLTPLSETRSDATDTVRCRKEWRNGQLLLHHNGKTYTIIGTLR